MLCVVACKQTMIVWHADSRAALLGWQDLQCMLLLQPAVICSSTASVASPKQLRTQLASRPQHAAKKLFYFQQAHLPAQKIDAFYICKWNTDGVQ